jgi:hypothetical protein
MKQKLKTFSEFAKWLLPLEVEYLKQSEKFQDAELQGMLSKISAYNKTGKLKFDEAVDKRKYSYLKNWIIRNLDAVDVDKNLLLISSLDKKVMTDTIVPEDEKQILNIIKNQKDLPYYFMRIYELVLDYQSFLLIRVRHHYGEIVAAYLEKNKEAYERSKMIFGRLSEATRDIISQYAFHKSESQKWESFLKEVFFDETLDGMNRYYAIVRLTFLYYNYNRLDQIVSLYDYLDGEITKGKFYSRRILLNYYSNRVILHAKLNESEKAIYYGNLSILDKGSDYIHYLNNLCSVLLKARQQKTALDLLQKSIPDLKNTISYHNRVGFASLLIRSLSANGKAAEAESYASSFYKAFKDKIMINRWHTFFSAYLQAMLLQEKYQQVIFFCRRQKLIDREKDYGERPAYIPTISWYYQLSRYKTGQIGLPELRTVIEESSRRFINQNAIAELKNEMLQHVPELFS